MHLKYELHAGMSAELIICDVLLKLITHNITCTRVILALIMGYTLKTHFLTKMPIPLSLNTVNGLCCPSHILTSVFFHSFPSIYLVFHGSGIPFGGGNPGQTTLNLIWGVLLSSSIDS